MKLQNNYFWLCVYLSALIFQIFGCSSDSDWIVNEKQMSKARPEYAMPVELFNKNIATTNYTAIVYVKRGKILNKPMWPLIYWADYLNHLYEADVIETFNGPYRKAISYSVMAEADAKPHISNYPQIVSLCGSLETGYYVPDNGYVSNASEELIDAGRDFKNKKKAIINPQVKVCGED